MIINRRQMIKGVGTAICAGVIPNFVPELIEDEFVIRTTKPYHIYLPGKSTIFLGSGPIRFGSIDNDKLTIIKAWNEKPTSTI